MSTGQPEVHNETQPQTNKTTTQKPPQGKARNGRAEESSHLTLVEQQYKREKRPKNLETDNPREEGKSSDHRQHKQG